MGTNVAEESATAIFRFCPDFACTSKMLVPTYQTTRCRIISDQLPKHFHV